MGKRQATEKLLIGRRTPKKTRHQSVKSKTSSRLIQITSSSESESERETPHPPERSISIHQKNVIRDLLPLYKIEHEIRIQTCAICEQLPKNFMGGRTSPSFSEGRKGLDLDTVTIATHEALDARSICLAIVCTSIPPMHTGGSQKVASFGPRHGPGRSLLFRMSLTGTPLDTDRTP
ncbi:hypothetical protein HNY73_021264 [Argiope bruennichi]|uniref:Uncharacterized protein n=1 Tax=Argiope bruennichi TaxID=94029 RepID=A0A8T0E9L1_ARGBR|nr:hypothetical protein HNY73_021264 [Argiope bruennichi]